jgi:hypothetical protein
MAGRGEAVPLSRGGRIERIVLGVVAVAVVVAAGGVWATRDSGSEPAPTRPATTATSEQAAPEAAASPKTGPAPVAAPAAAPAPSTPPPVPEPVLADGRHPAFLTDIDVSGGTLQFDLVQFLTGEAAQAYVEDEYEEDGGEGEPPEFEYDFLIVNENSRLRTLPVDPGVEITVLRTPASAADPHPIAFADLRAYLDEIPYGTADHLGSNVFWLTVRDGRVVAMEEQFES